MRQRRIITDLAADARRKIATNRPPAKPISVPTAGHASDPMYMPAMGRPTTDAEVLQLLAGYGVTGEEAMRQLAEMKSCNGGNVYRPIETVPVQKFHIVGAKEPLFVEGRRTSNDDITKLGQQDKVQMQYVNPPPTHPFTPTGSKKK